MRYAGWRAIDGAGWEEVDEFLFAPGRWSTTRRRCCSGRVNEFLAVDSLVRELLVACTEPHLPPTEGRHIRAVLHDRLRRADVQPLSLPTPRDRRLADACHLVTNDLTQPRSIDWLARGRHQRTHPHPSVPDGVRHHLSTVANPDPRLPRTRPPRRRGDRHRDSTPLRVGYQQRIHGHLHPHHGPNPPAPTGQPQRAHLCPELPPGEGVTGAQSRSPEGAAARCP